MEKSVLFLHHDEIRSFGNRKLIDVWWRGPQAATAELMLLLGAISFPSTPPGMGHQYTLVAGSATEKKAANILKSTYARAAGKSARHEPSRWWSSHSAG